MDERKDRLIDSAEQWENQAYQLMLERLGERPSIEQVRTSCGSEEWLAAFALLDLSPAVRADAAQYTEWARDAGRFTYEGEGEGKVSTFHPSALMNWDGWVSSVGEEGRGWSSTEDRLYQLVAALVADRPLKLRGVLDAMNSWEREVLDIVVQWASGGNNRDLPGRHHLAGGADQ